MQEIFKRIIERMYESGVCSGNEESGFILLNKARQIVEQAAEGYNNGWISCSECSRNEEMEDKYKEKEQ